MKRNKTCLLDIVLSVCVALLVSVNAYAHQQDNQNSALTGSLVVVNKTDNSVSIIDIESASIVATLPTGEGPHELIISKDGRWAVSTDFVGGDSLTVFDLAELKVARRIDLADYKGPHGIRFIEEREQNHVMFTSGTSQHVAVANIHTGKIVSAAKTAQNTTHMLAIDKQAGFVYTTNIRSNSLTQLSLTPLAKVQDLDTKAMPEAINISQAAKQLWYGANKDGIVTVLDLLELNQGNSEELASFENFSFPYRVLFNHAQNIALVPDFRAHKVRFFDTQQLTEIGQLDLAANAGPQGIVLHPTLDIAFLSLNLLHKVIAIDISTRRIIGEYPTGNNPDGIGYTHLSFRAD